MRWARAFGIVVLGAAVGCSSGSGSGSGSGAPTDASGFCDGTLGELLRFLDRTCSAADKQTDAYQFLYAFSQAIALSCPGVLGKSIDQGRAALSPQAAQKCVDGYELLFAGAGLENLNEPDPAIVAACDGALIGKQAPGAPCAQPYECQTGYTCVGFTPEADGTCQAPELGQACGAGESQSGELTVTFDFGNHPDCAGEAFCDTVFVNNESTKQCVAKLGTGESCFDDDECQTGLGCYIGVCQTGGPSAIGGECAEDDDCEDAAYCDTSGTSGVCAAKKASGQACGGAFLGGSECLGTCSIPEGSDTGTCVAFCGSG
jgi:hypothetical protein